MCQELYSHDSKFSCDLKCIPVTGNVFLCHEYNPNDRNYILVKDI